MTDATGELRVIVPPGKRKINLNACPPEYTLNLGEHSLSDVLTLLAGKTVHLTDRLRKQ